MATATSIPVGDWLSTGVPKPTDPCGLFISGDDAKAVPLKRRDVTGDVYVDGCFADVAETFSYVAGDQDCTATFKFPLPPRAAVYR